MRCVYHPEAPAAAYCRECGKPLCWDCRRVADGTVYCAEHVPEPQPAAQPPAPEAPPPPSPQPEASPSPYAEPYAPPPATPAARRDTIPALAFFLGFIPGVGAIYNEQYAKGLLHVVVFGLLVSILSAGAVSPFEPLFAMLLAVFFFYMAFEAYHTARRRQAGEPVNEFSSILPLERQDDGFPAGPIILIVLGIIFLLNNLGLLRMYQIMRYWPVILIAIGFYLLTQRASHERR